jgi:hypothetical protein
LLPVPIVTALAAVAAGSAAMTTALATVPTLAAAMLALWTIG